MGIKMTVNTSTAALSKPTICSLSSIATTNTSGTKSTLKASSINLKPNIQPNPVVNRPPSTISLKSPAKSNVQPNAVVNRPPSTICLKSPAKSNVQPNAVVNR